MLKHFSVDNFKNFDEKLSFDLSSPANYGFHTDLIEKNIITKGMVYGINSSGKSNLGLALLDIVCHLTDKQKLLQHYTYYSNMNNAKSVVTFEYTFAFDGVEVKYCYKKTDVMSLLFEQLFIDGKEMLYYDHEKKEGYTKLKGSETLNSSIRNDSNISRVRYVFTNAILQDDTINHAFHAFMEYVDHMLLFYSLDERGYQGFYAGTESISKGIIESGQLKDFEAFLNENGILYHLEEKDIDGEKKIYCQFNNQSADFFQIASTGTRSVALLYFWYIKMQQASFVFIDEFDAFYHSELAQSIVRRLLKLQHVQIFLTTHNTDLLSNDLMRPDCYFLLENGSLKMFSECTEKELRQAHNLQKMYKAGAFDGK